MYNHGDIKRDFTYINDIIEGVVRVMHRIPEPDDQWSSDCPDPVTWADVDDLMKETGFAPSTPLERGIPEFVRWYCKSYNKDKAHKYKPNFE